jgi:hypothetical protein
VDAHHVNPVEFGNIHRASPDRTEAFYGGSIPGNLDQFNQDTFFYQQLCGGYLGYGVDPSGVHTGGL